MTSPLEVVRREISEFESERLRLLQLTSRAPGVLSSIYGTLVFEYESIISRLKRIESALEGEVSLSAPDPDRMIEFRLANLLIGRTHEYGMLVVLNSESEAITWLTANPDGTVWRVQAQTVTKQILTLVPDTGESC